MKVSGIISALVFAHVALGQATDSTSAAVSSSTGTKSGSKSASHSQSASASSSATPDATPTGSTGSVGPLTKEITGDSDPLIPSGISETCSVFLQALNTDTTVSSCMASLNTALSSFTSGPGSKSAISRTLGSLCSSSACGDSYIKSKLTEFKDACSDELIGSNPNDVVVQQYDIWYSLMPFKAAICAKGDNTEYCMLNTTSSSSTQNTRRSDLGYAAGHLVTPLDKRAQTVLVPDAETYHDYNLMYLFTSREISHDQLCTSCSQKVFWEYFQFGADVPYALGLSKSPLLSGRNKLYAEMGEKCGSEFAEQATKGITSAEQLNGVVATTVNYFTPLAAAFAAAFALF